MKLTNDIKNNLAVIIFLISGLKGINHITNTFSIGIFLNHAHVFFKYGTPFVCFVIAIAAETYALLNGDKAKSLRFMAVFIGIVSLVYLSGIPWKYSEPLLTIPTAIVITILIILLGNGRIRNKWR